jgi:colicin import membrane protein
LSAKSLSRPINDPFAKFIGASLVFHFSVVLLFTVKALVFPTEELIIADAIRVDLVGLPDKVEPPKPVEAAPEPPAPVPAPPPPAEATPPTKPKAETKPEPKPAPKPDLKKAKADQNKALDRLKALQSIEAMEKDLKEKSKVEPTKEYKGNVLNAGDSLTGLDRLDHNQYFSTVRKHVQQNFVLPQWLADSSFKAKAIVKIDERGFVISRELTQPSGDPTFDSKVLEAIDNASPLPPPPERLKNVVALKGMVFNFPD